VQKLTAQGTVFGSPLYMSPEQCEGRATDARSDVYSSCCTLYECLKGQPPFMGETPLQTMGMHRSDSPSPLALPGLDGFLIEQAIMKGLAKSPDERFQNARELLDCLNSQMPTAPLTKQGEDKAAIRQSANENENALNLPQAMGQSFWNSPVAYVVMAIAFGLLFVFFFVIRFGHK